MNLPTPGSEKHRLGPHRPPVARGATTWVWVVGLVIALGVLTTVVMVDSPRLLGEVSIPDDGGVSPDPDDSDSGPSTTVDARTTDEIIADITAFVERERGLEFKEPVKVELAGEGDFQDRLLADFDEDLEDLRKTESLMKALHLIEEDVKLEDALRGLLGAGVVGFYDSETNELVVRGDTLSPYVQTTVAHELVHALDDQHFELERPAVDDSDDEQSFGFTALVEGNASRVEDAYRASMTEEEQLSADQEEFMFGLGVDPTVFPPTLIESLIAPYLVGPDLVEALLADGGQNRLDASFAKPPTTSEQVLHPAAYLAGEPRAEVPVPVADGELIDQGAVGEFTITQVLKAGDVDDDDAEEAAEGWGGDWFVAWTDASGDTCVRAIYKGDTPRDTDQLGEAWEKWADEVGGATVTTDEAGVTVTSCV